MTPVSKVVCLTPKGCSSLGAGSEMPGSWILTRVWSCLGSTGKQEGKEIEMLDHNYPQRRWNMCWLRTQQDTRVLSGNIKVVNEWMVSPDRVSQ